jgi:hypothetical protein
MRIKKVELKSFKRFTHLLIEDIPDVEVFVIFTGKKRMTRRCFL